MHEPAAELEQIFQPGGILDQRLPSYEFRASQLQMARAVLDAIRGRYHLCVEAGTGTGKTLSYLIPALFSGQRVIISTATRNLQEQLFLKDIPFITKHLFPKLKATYMKGRQNYLCLKRFEEQRSQRMIQESELQKAFVRLDSWRHATETGDRSELEWLSDRDPLWDSLDARSDACTGQKCPHFRDCFVTQMRQRSFESDIVVVNHALFFANLALESDEIGRVLPDFAVLILDEAHEIEDIAAEHFGRRLSNHQINDLSRSLHNAFSQSEEMQKCALRLQLASQRFFSSFPAVEGSHSLNLYRVPGRPVVDLRLDLGREVSDLDEALRAAYHRLELEKDPPPEVESLVRRLELHLVSLEAIFSQDSTDHVYWFERSGRGVYLHTTPIKMASLLRERLFSRVESAILTSATLTTGGDFSYIKGRIGIPEPEELIVPGEFDYRKQALLYIPRTMPEPRRDDLLLHQLREIRSILSLTEGHAFLLFTSVYQMKRVHEALQQSGEYPLLCQGEKPRSLILEAFRKTPHAVLCATSSFWQGVDVQGDALRAVVIDKLPFHVPTEPLVAARSEKLAEEGENPFLAYSVPAAIITLRQGLGRLIRSRKDRGILAILDSRVWRKQYGRLFLKSLPNCPVTDNIEDLKTSWMKLYLGK